MTKLYAPEEFWTLPAGIKARICNGCGRDGWKGKLIPDHLLFLSITAACDIHDFMYYIGKTLDDKEAADRVFLNNMLRIIESDSVWILKRSRRHLAVDYYGSVVDFGGPSFWADKNENSCLGIA